MSEPLSPTASGLFAEHQPFVLTIARKIAKRLPRFIDPDELFTAGLSGLWYACRHFRPERNCAFRSYVFTCVRWAIYDWLRDAYQSRRQGTAPIPFSQVESSFRPLEFADPASEESRERFEDVDLLQFALRALSPRHRRVVQLFYFERLSTPAIAERLECGESCVFHLLSKARARMRSFLTLSEKSNDRCRSSPALRRR